MKNKSMLCTSRENNVTQTTAGLEGFSCPIELKMGRGTVTSCTNIIVRKGLVSEKMWRYREDVRWKWFGMGGGGGGGEREREMGVVQSREMEKERGT